MILNQIYQNKVFITVLSTIYNMLALTEFKGEIRLGFNNRLKMGVVTAQFFLTCYLRAYWNELKPPFYFHIITTKSSSSDFPSNFLCWCSLATVRLREKMKKNVEGRLNIGLIDFVSSIFRTRTFIYKILIFIPIHSSGIEITSSKMQNYLKKKFYHKLQVRTTKNHIIF